MPTISSKGRGPTFGDQEVSHMLDLIEERSPIGSQEWDMIEALHNAKFPDQKRTKETIKRKFSMLYSTRSPTGDPNCPPLVRRAKRIYNQIRDRTDLVADDDDDDESLESNQDREEMNNSVGQTSTIASINIDTPVGDPFVGTMPPATGRSNTTRENSFRAPMQRIGSKRNIQSDNMMDRYLEWMMMQRQLDREEQKERREEERREEERKREFERLEEEKRRRDERERREEERQRHNSSTFKSCFLCFSYHSLLLIRLSFRLERGS